MERVYKVSFFGGLIEGFFVGLEGRWGREAEFISMAGFGMWCMFREGGCLDGIHHASRRAMVQPGFFYSRWGLGRSFT